MKPFILMTKDETCTCASFLLHGIMRLGTSELHFPSLPLPKSVYMLVGGRFALTVSPCPTEDCLLGIRGFFVR